MIVSIIIGVLAALIVVGVIVSTYIKRRRGEIGCGCDCSKCSGCSHGQGQNQAQDPSQTESATIEPPCRCGHCNGES